MLKADLTGKVAVITGSNRGIGRGIAELFAGNGANVVITNEESLDTAQEVADEITTLTGKKAIGLKLDLRKEKDVLNCIKETIKIFKKIDILVNNAGVQIIHPINEFITEDWDKLTDIHLRGAFLMSRECIKHMKLRGKGGKIIFTGSVHSLNASSNKIAYISSKHGQAGMVKAISVECGQYNISANLVAPGFVLTDLAKKQIPQRAKVENKTEDEIKKSMVKNTVDGNFTTVEEVAQATLFFASFEGLALTGQSIVVSHGWCMK